MGAGCCRFKSCHPDNLRFLHRIRANRKRRRVVAHQLPSATGGWAPDVSSFQPDSRTGTPLARRANVPAQSLAWCFVAPGAVEEEPAAEERKSARRVARRYSALLCGAHTVAATDRHVERRSTEGKSSQHCCEWEKACSPGAHGTEAPPDNGPPAFRSKRLFVPSLVISCGGRRTRRGRHARPGGMGRGRCSSGESWARRHWGLARQRRSNRGSWSIRERGRGNCGAPAGGRLF